MVEFVNDELKNIGQIEHIRHRSDNGFRSNPLSGLIVHSFLPKLPAMNIEIFDEQRIAKDA